MTALSHAIPLHSILPLAFALPLVAADGPTLLAAQELPPAIQADRLLLQAEDQIEDESYTEALRILDQILDLRAEHDLELPDGFWFKHAHVAMLADSVPKAKTSVLKYFELTGQGGEHYREALELLNAADRHLEEAERLRIEADSQRVEDEGHREALLRQAESTSPGRVFRNCNVCPVMVNVPPGSFTMGSPASEDGRLDYEGPRHRVTIEYSFAVGVYEVTFAEWDACVRADACGRYRPDDEGWGRGRRPVINVNWEDAQEYVRWLSRETGAAYRLLSEAEYEYVARAGTETARYWGESESGQCGHGNGKDRTGEHVSGWRTADCSDGYAYTAPVGSYQPNAFGLYDVLGNVGEWTEDCANEDYWGAPTDGSAWRSGDCSHRVLRDGSWYYSPSFLRSAHRGWYLASVRGDGLFGFRVARTMN